MKDYTRKINYEDANRRLNWIIETPIFDEDNYSGYADDHHQEKVRNLTLKEARDEIDDILIDFVKLKLKLS